MLPISRDQTGHQFSPGSPTENLVKSQAEQALEPVMKTYFTKYMLYVLYNIIQLGRNVTIL